MNFTWQTSRDLVCDGRSHRCGHTRGADPASRLYWLAHRFIHLRNSSQHVLVSRIARPAGFVLPLAAVLAVFPALPLPRAIEEPAAHTLLLCLIAAVAWLVVRLIGYAEHVVTRRYETNVQDNLAARRIRTQVEVFRRIAESRRLLAAVAVSADDVPGYLERSAPACWPLPESPAWSPA